MMKKNILILALGCLGLVGSLSAMNLDDLSGRILADVLYADRLDETVECVKKQTAVLSHTYLGLSLFTHITALYDDAKSRLKGYKAQISRLVLPLEEAGKRLKELQAQDTTVARDEQIRTIGKQILKLERELNPLIIEQQAIEQKVFALKEAYKAFLVVGKGDALFVNSMPTLMAELEVDKKARKPFIAALQDTYPDMFPSPEEVVEDEQDDDEKDEDELFIYTPIQPGHGDIAVKAFSYQRHLCKLNARYSRINLDALSEADLCERDLRGTTFIRRIAERWFIESPKTDEEKRGYTTFRGGFMGTTLYWYSHDPYWHEALAKNFTECLDKGASYPLFLTQLDDLMECLLENKDGYQTLITLFEGKFPGKLALYEYRRKNNPPVALTPVSPEKISAYFAADLVCALISGDEKLTNAFEIIKERPALVHACSPDGMPVLFQVLRLHNAASDEKKKRLALFFDFLLVNGADYVKKYAIQKTERVYVNGYYNPYPHYVNGYYTVQVDTVQLSVEDILDDSTKDFRTERMFDPYRTDYDNELKDPIDQETALFFKRRLDAFKANKRAPFEGKEGQWLEEEMMPTPPVVKEPKAQAQMPSKNETPDDANMDELLKNYSESSFWEDWKSPIKYLTAGIVVAGIGYWLKNRSWGDPYEELRHKRDLLRAASAQAA